MSTGVVDTLIKNLLQDISENIQKTGVTMFRFYPEQSRHWLVMKASFVADYSYPYNNPIHIEDIVEPFTAVLTSSYPDYNIEYHHGAFTLSKKL